MAFVVNVLASFILLVLETGCRLHFNFNFRFLATSIIIGSKLQLWEFKMKTKEIKIEHTSNSFFMLQFRLTFFCISNKVDKIEYVLVS